MSYDKWNCSKKIKKNAEKILILISNDIDIGIRIITIVYRVFLFISYQLRIDYVRVWNFRIIKLDDLHKKEKKRFVSLFMQNKLRTLYWEEQHK